MLIDPQIRDTPRKVTKGIVTDAVNGNTWLEIVETVQMLWVILHNIMIEETQDKYQQPLTISYTDSISITNSL